MNPAIETLQECVKYVQIQGHTYLNKLAAEIYQHVRYAYDLLQGTRH